MSFAAIGYWLQCLLSELNGKPQLPGGPTDNLSKNFVTGLKLFVGYVIIGIAAGLVVGLISVILSKMQIVAALITLVLEIATMFAAIFLTLSFAMDRKILSMLDVQRTMQIMKGHCGYYFMLYNSRWYCAGSVYLLYVGGFDVQPYGTIPQRLALYCTADCKKTTAESTAAAIKK